MTDEDEEYEESGKGNRLLGFMFGNVDNSGDLDVDYLDEVSSCIFDVTYMLGVQIYENFDLHASLHLGTTKVLNRWD